MSITWLPLSHRKNISQVKIVYEPNHRNYSGYYTLGSKTLTIVEQENEKDIASVIAHEFRHHVQYETNVVKLKVISFDVHLPYDKAIRKYFRSSLSELDALIYQNKFAPSETSEWWLKELVDDKGYCKRLF